MNTVKSRDIECIVADARDWEFYFDAHGDIWQANEWARNIVKALLKAADES